MNLASSTDSRVSLRARFRTATREAILDAAAGLMGSDGAAQTRMEDIAARAGVAVGTVYNYFEDRTALVSALLETRTVAMLEVLDRASAPAPAARRLAGVAAPSAPFASELERFVSALGTHIDANRFLLGVLMDDERSRGIDAKVASRRRSVMDELMVRAERLMERGIKARALRKDDPALYAALLVGMVRGVALSALSRGDAFSADGAAAIIRVFMTGAAR